MKVRSTLLLISLVLVMSFHTRAVEAATGFGTSNFVVKQQPDNSISSNEASMLLLLRYIHAAEATFISTTGAGRYGTLQQLYLARLIDVRVRTGVNDGYRFVLSVSNPSGGPSTFDVIARPVTYMETGIRTFAINHAAELRVSYVQNASPTQMHLITDECGSVQCTEGFARSALRTIHSAEATFQATYGNGRYGTLEELAQHSFIPATLATGSLNGYSFRVRVDNGSMTELPSFEALATPLRFPRTGVLSFYMDESGIMRGANKQGLDADANDSPYCQ